MAVSLTIDKRLDVAVEGDTYATVILGMIPADTADPKAVYEFVQTSALTEAGVAVRPYGLVVIPNKISTTLLSFDIKNVVTGALYRGSNTLSLLTQGSTVSMSAVT